MGISGPIPSGQIGSILFLLSVAFHYLQPPPVASVHYLKHWLYVVVECSHVSSKRGPQSRALPLVGPIPCPLVFDWVVFDHTSLDHRRVLAAPTT